MKDVNTVIEKLMPFIKMKAKDIADGPWDWDDFIQEGRIAVWLALEHDPEGTYSFIRQRIVWGMLAYARKIYPNNEVGLSPHHENLLYGNGEFDIYAE